MIFYIILIFTAGELLLLIFVKEVEFIVLTTIFYLIMLVSIGILFYKYDKNPKYQQNISYPIYSKEINRERDVPTYKITVDIKSLFSFKVIYVTKEEYDLLKEGDEIPFIYNIKLKKKKFNEERFNELIKKLKMKKEVNNDTTDSIN